MQISKITSAGNATGREFFQAFTVAYLLLLLAESIKKGFVTSFININYLLLIVLISGILMVITENRKQVTAYSRKASRAVIGLAIKSAYQARQARLAAQQMQQTQRQALEARQQAGRRAVAHVQRVAAQAVHRQPAAAVAAVRPTRSSMEGFISSQVNQTTPRTRNGLRIKRSAQQPMGPMQIGGWRAMLIQ